ncbi:MAG: GGDEF domain-containing protein [Sphingopyxis sp.]|nr:GGDEF domain-containing protein [Sphingopyxis sp.]
MSFISAFDLFGRRGKTPVPGSENDAPPGDMATAKPAILSPRAALRADMLAEISAFICEHDLDISTANFEFAREIVAGHDYALAARMQDWIAEKGQLTNDGVADIMRAHRPDALDAAALAQMLVTLEGNAQRIDALNGETQGSANAFSEALSHQAGTLGTGNVTLVVAEMLSLTRTMIERTRNVEERMRESQKETRKLHRSLSAARHAADHDHLTGLPNRRAFDVVLREEMELAQANDEALIVAFCDIDNFKAVNDRYGHPTGDRVLKFVADLLSRITNKKCHIARHGGEEFALLFRGKSLDEAFAIVDQAREDLAERSLVLKDRNERLDTITFSAGMADLFSHANVRSALEAADQALYRAKNAGRNRICRG